MQTAHLYDWNSVAGAEVRDGVTKKSIGGDDASLTLITIRAGTVADRHNHPHEQFVHVLSGHARIKTDDDECEVRAGSVLHLPSNTYHSAVFDEDTVLVEINVNPGETG